MIYNNVSERNLHDRLLNIVHEEHIDNQKVLTLFFPSKNYLPLKDCSTQVKVLCFLMVICVLVLYQETGYTNIENINFSLYVYQTRK